MLCNQTCLEKWRIEMLSICLFLSNFAIMGLFFIFVIFRIDPFSAALAYVLIFFPNTIPFVVIYLEQSKVEKKKAQISEHSDGN